MFFRETLNLYKLFTFDFFVLYVNKNKIAIKNIYTET